MDIDLKCEEGIVTFDLEYGASFDCWVCKSPNTIRITNLNSEISEKTRCLPLVPIKNCKTINKPWNYLKNDFECEECENNYYLKDQETCMERTRKSI